MAEQFALVSVSDKSEVERVARALIGQGYRLLSTGGTARHLREHGLDVTDVSDITGFPEIMNGRVKTLHPKIHGGLLARRDDKDHRAAMEEHQIPLIDVVIVNLYPFRETVAQAGIEVGDALEQIDIGGPCMLRAAAKNFPWVSVIVDPDDYDSFIDTLDHDGPDDSMRRALARKAFAHTASYDTAVASYLTENEEPTPDAFSILLERTEVLRYGENPHQAAALYSRHPAPDYGGFVQLHGKALSYNNIVDLDAAYALISEFDAPAAAVIKHTNPAGCAIGQTVEAAFDHALLCDPVSAFGGIVSLNRPLGRILAEKIAETFFEIVAAPSFDSDALGILARKKNLRLLTVPTHLLSSKWSYRPTALGWLAQETDPDIELDFEELEVPTKRKPSDEELRDLAFSWRCSKHVKSNAIVLARNGATIGVGAGQMSRVDAVDLAVRKARSTTVGTVLASDAFFPFRDGPDAAAAAGVTAIIQPGGSKRDPEVIAACDEHGIAMVFTGQRHFRH